MNKIDISSLPKDFACPRQDFSEFRFYPVINPPTIQYVIYDHDRNPISCGYMPDIVLREIKKHSGRIGDCYFDFKDPYEFQDILTRFYSAADQNYKAVKEYFVERADSETISLCEKLLNGNSEEKANQDGSDPASQQASIQKYMDFVMNEKVVAISQYTNEAIPPMTLIDIVSRIGVYDFSKMNETLMDYYTSMLSGKVTKDGMFTIHRITKVD